MPYPVLMPVFARDILKGDVGTLGLLMAGAGAGALTGAIFLASRKSPRGLVRIIITASLIFGAGLVLFSFSRMLALSLIFIAVAGFGMVTQMAASNTFIQLIADDDKRGRVMGYYVMAFMGLSPFGSLIFGWLASIIGAPFTLMAGGLCSMIGGMVFAGRFRTIRDQVRSAYRQKGLVDE
jgi:MFS family permease